MDQMSSSCLPKTSRSMGLVGQKANSPLIKKNFQIRDISSSWICRDGSTEDEHMVCENRKGHIADI